MHFPPSGFVYPGLHLHQAAWLSASQYALGPQDIVVHGVMHVLFKHAIVFGHSLLELHNSFCDGPSSGVPKFNVCLIILKKYVNKMGMILI